MAGTVRC